MLRRKAYLVQVFLGMTQDRSASILTRSAYHSVRCKESITWAEQQGKHYLLLNRSTKRVWLLYPVIEFPPLVFHNGSVHYRGCSLNRRHLVRTVTFHWELWVCQNAFCELLCLFIYMYVCSYAFINLFAIQMHLKHDQELVLQHDFESCLPHCQRSPVSQPKRGKGEHLCELQIAWLRATLIPHKQWSFLKRDISPSQHRDQDVWVHPSLNTLTSFKLG